LFNKFLVVPLLILLTVLTAGCSNDVSASLTAHSFGGHVRLVCDDAQFQKEQYDEFFHDLPSASRTQIEIERKSAEKDCSALSAVWDTVEGTHKQLRDGIYWPHSVYLFNLSVPEGNANPVGFFDSSSSCRDARDGLREAGYDSEDCYERILFWKTAWAQ